MNSSEAENVEGLKPGGGGRGAPIYIYIYIYIHIDIRVALTTSGGTGEVTDNGTIRLLSVRCS